MSIEKTVNDLRGHGGEDDDACHQSADHGENSECVNDDLFDLHAAHCDTEVKIKQVRKSL